MRYLIRTIGMAAMLAIAPTLAVAQAEPAGDDFTLTTCGELAGLTEEDRAFALIFYYGYLAGHSGAKVIDNGRVPEHLVRVRDYCTASPDSPIVDAFVAALK